MKEIRFYHMTQSPLEKTLPDLLAKTLGRGWRAVVVLENRGAIDEISSLIWGYRPHAFLAHSVKGDGMEKESPLYLSTEIENPNSANVLFLCNGTILGGEGDYDLVCDLFDGRFDDTKAAARERYVAYREKGYSLTYWQQTETGWTNQNGR